MQNQMNDFPEYTRVSLQEIPDHRIGIRERKLLEHKYKTKLTERRQEDACQCGDCSWRRADRGHQRIPLWRDICCPRKRPDKEKALPFLIFDPDNDRSEVLYEKADDK